MMSTDEYQITTNIMGGLGNQMFQIFNAISYSLDNNCNYIFPSEKVLYAGENATLRYAYWDTLFYKLQPFLQDEKDIHYDIKIEESNDSSFIILLPIKDYISYFKKHCKYPLNNFSMYLRGYFQSYKYFQHNFIKITKLLGFYELKKNVFEIVSNEYNLCYYLNNSISLHFRIGDFVKYTNSHIILSDQYYADSIKTIIDKLNNKNSQHNIIYFCEDNDIDIVCKRIENIQKLLTEKSTEYNCVFIKAPSVLTDWQQMLFMSICKHNIIANSSFSWWGAYLNENPDKIVCYSSVYYSKNYNKKVDDLFPENWIKIQDNYTY